MIDLSRKNFEEYYNDWGGFGCQYCLHHRMGDSYNIPDIAKAWRHWQASRECLVIELPRPAGLDRMSSEMSIQEIREDNRFNRALELAKKALTAAGVKYK